MELKSNQASHVLADVSPVNNSSLGIHSNLLSYTLVPRRKLAKFEDVRSNGWLDAMKSSSPPRKKHIKNANVEVALDDTDFAYSSWMVKYPSALRSFEWITINAKNKKIALFLDYDGTLSPIVDDPDRAFMSDAMRSAVRNVAKYFPTAIISGRSRDKVYELVGLTELYYAGSHGMDIMSPVAHTVSCDHPNCIKSADHQGKDVNLFQPAREFIPMIDEVFRTLVENVKGIKGAKVENHKFCASVHYRNVDEKSWPTIAQLVHDILKEYPRLRLTHGRKVLEIRPVIDWNKGKAVEFLLGSFGLEDKDNLLPIYIGDDKTDEDAFKALRKGKWGFGILVSAIPKETSALYSLRDPREVKEFLKFLCRWKQLQQAGITKVTKRGMSHSV